MIRICFISSYPPSRGRLSEYAYNLLNELENCPKIEQIDVLTHVSNDLISESSNKIKIHKTWNPENPLSLFNILFQIVSLRPDIVHFNVHMAVFGGSRIENFIGLSLPLWSRILGFKTVTTLHNIFEKIDIEKVGFKDSFLNRFSAYVVTKFIASASTVTLTLQSHVRLFKTKYKSKKVKRIPHGTWINNNGKTTDKKMGKTILFFGHSGPYKDIELLLDAFDIIRSRIKNSKLIIAGTSHPNYPGYLESYQIKNESNDVTFKGYVPEDLLPPLFEEADVVILPYRTCTGTSGVAHLASSFGTPIIATDLPEFRELLNEGCGLLLSSHNPEAVADLIENTLINITLANELKEKNLNFAKKRTWAQIASSFCELYNELVADK